MTLTTERLVLRPLVDSDLDAFAAIVADPEVQQYVGGPKTRREAWREMALYEGHRALRGYSQEAIIERGTGRLIGRAGLWFPEGWEGLEVGWVLARGVWGQGYATEAGAAWRDYAFGVLAAEDLISLIDPTNDRSAAVARRIGHEHWRMSEINGMPVEVWGQRRPS